MLITKREKEVLHLLSLEFTSKEIAEQLCVSQETVMSHRKNMRRKFNAKNTAGLISKAFRQGVVMVNTTIIFMEAHYHFFNEINI